MMKHLLTAAALVLALSGAARADDYVKATCMLFGCVFESLPSAATRIIQIPGGMQATEEEQARWRAFCKPEFYHDSLGVARAVYAHKGCEFGRDRP